MSKSNHDPEPDEQRRLKIVLMLLAALLALVALWQVYQYLDSSGMLENIMDSHWLHQRAAGLGIWGPLLIIVLMALAIVLNPIPSAPIALASGAAFGHAWGTLYVVIGAEIGALAAFALARVFGRGLLCQLFGKRFELGWEGSQNTLTWLVFVSRLLPFISFDLISYGAGLTPLKTWRFALATLLGLIPISFLLAHFGGELNGANMHQMTVVLLLAGLLITAPLAIKFLISRIRRTPPDKKP